MSNVRASEHHVAVRNAMILGASLVATWGVALVVRLLLPRRLGPELFGSFNFADTLAATCFVFLHFGMEPYIQKEIPVRPEHASDFFGGVVLARIVAALPVTAAIVLVVIFSHRSAAVERSAIVFAFAQLLVQVGNTLAALLHASRTVGRLAVLNVASKVLWAGGVAFALVYWQELEAFALAFVLGEALRTAILWRVARKNLGLRFRVDLRATKEVLRASTPYYVNAVAIALYAKIDISIMAMLASDKEIGWYGSAANFAGIAMLLAPLMGAVLMPQLSRAAAKSRGELLAMLRRSLELLMIFAIPISMMLGIGADVWVRFVFGPAFEPAVGSLRVLAPMFTVTYLAMLCAIYLTLLGRGWTVTIISILSVLLNAGLNVLLIRPALRALGEGGAGLCAGTLSVATELAVAGTMLVIIGHEAFDKRNVATTFKSLGVCAVVVVADNVMRPLGPARLLADVALYTILIVVSGAVRPVELLIPIRAALSARRGQNAEA